MAMPGVVEPTFSQAVIFLCAHSAEGAMGLIINKPVVDMNFMELADRVDFSKSSEETRTLLAQTPVFMGGPVEQQRGFVLHSTEYEGGDGSLKVNDGYALTATVDILEDLAAGAGPLQYILALGYAGWAPGQLENEIHNNGWLHGDADPALVFSKDFPVKYRKAMATIGVDPRMLSSDAGHG